MKRQKIEHAQLKFPNSEKLLYLNPGTFLLLLSSIPGLIDLAKVLTAMFLCLDSKYFPLSFSKV